MPEEGDGSRVRLDYSMMFYQPIKLTVEFADLLRYLRIMLRVPFLNTSLSHSDMGSGSFTFLEVDENNRVSVSFFYMFFFCSRNHSV